MPTDVSDHFSIFHLICDNSTAERFNSDFNLQRNINDNSVTNCISILHNTDWNNVLQSNDTETAYEIFHEKLTKAVNDTMPIKKVKINKRKLSKPWITKGLLTSIAHKNSMYKRLKLTGNKSLEVQYKTFKNKLNNLLRSSEKSYYKSILDKNKNNLSKLWKTINTVINRKKQPHKTVTFKHSNKEIVNNLDIANHFNNYYLNVTKDMCNKIPKTNQDPCKYLGNKVTNSLFLSPTDENEILGIISKLKNSSSSHDGISVKLMKKVKFQILKPLAHIINLSFSQGKIPDSLKIAKVVPIHKKGDCSLFSNYRPISILPAFSKIMKNWLHTNIKFYNQTQYLERQPVWF